jgi:sRNA-binding regulator protein Hfq
MGTPATGAHRSGFCLLLKKQVLQEHAFLHKASTIIVPTAICQSHKRRPGIMRAVHGNVCRLVAYLIVGRSITGSISVFDRHGWQLQASQKQMSWIYNCAVHG